jgi:hypothetical protein
MSNIKLVLTMPLSMGMTTFMSASCHSTDVLKVVGKGFVQLEDVVAEPPMVYRCSSLQHDVNILASSC